MPRHFNVQYDASKPVRPAIKKVARGVKNYGKNVVGGAKIVGGAIKRAANKLFK